MFCLYTLLEGFGGSMDAVECAIHRNEYMICIYRLIGDILSIKKYKDKEQEERYNNAITSILPQLLNSNLGKVTMWSP